MNDTLKDALNEIDDTYIAEAAEPYRRNSMVGLVAALAAMLVLLISVAFALGKDPGGPVQMGSQPGSSIFLPSNVIPSCPSSAPTEPTKPGQLFQPSKIPMADFTDELAKLTVLPSIGSGPRLFGSSEPSSGLHFGLYSDSLVVEARVKEILPDLYVDPTNYNRYYVLVMETLESFNVENMPKEFYFQLPYPMCPNLDRFDSLILTLHQYGLEDYLLVNETTSTWQTFDKMFNCYDYDVDYGAVIAFNDGTIDISLWKLANWENHGDKLDSIVKLLFYGESCYTIEECKAYIHQRISKYEDCQNKSVLSKADFSEVEVFAYTAPFRNGAFHHYIYCGKIYFTRLINGIETNEHFSLGIEQADCSFTPIFTREDLSSMPDTRALIAELSARLDTMVCHNAAYYEEKGMKLVNTWIEAKYVKLEGKIVALVSVNWEYEDPNYYNPAKPNQSQLYYLITQDGFCRVMQILEPKFPEVE